METAESRSGIMSHCIGGVMATIQSYFQLKLRVRRKQNKSVIDVINVKNNKNKDCLMIKIQFSFQAPTIRNI